MTIIPPQRHGGVTSAALALILLVIVVTAAIFMIPGLKDRLFGVTPEPASSNDTAAYVVAPPSRVGAVTAVRAKEGMPTFCLVAGNNPPPAIGSTLQVMRNGKSHATLLLESVTGDQLTCRVTTWATGTQELAVGDVVEKP